MTNHKLRYSYKAFPRLLKAAFKELTANDPLRMAGATAFFTTFALPAILVILIQLLGLFFNEKDISHKLIEALAAILEKESVHQVVRTLVAFRKLAQNWYITIGGFLFLVFVATTLFKVIQSSINQLWKIRVVKKRSVWMTLRTRVQSVLVIIMAAVLFIPGLLVSGAQAFLENSFYNLSPDLSFFFNTGLNYLLSVIIVTLWFTVMFRYLPDGRPEWKVALTGAFVTSILFNTGKLILRWLLTHSNIHSMYGASGSIVLLLLFVFYSSLILYYGAAFTKMWGIWHNQPIMPLPHAMKYKLVQVSDTEH